MTFEDIANPVVQFCFVMVVGFIVSRILLRRQQVWRLIAQIALFILLTVVLLHNNIVPYEQSARESSVSLRIFGAFAKIVWWINGAWMLVAFVRVFLIFERKPREGRLLQDLIVGVIYMGAALSIISDVFGVPVGTLLATSGVFAIILGLALQSTLNDLFSGIALNLGRPYTVGDWIVLDDGLQGRVIETNWRATYLQNGTNDRIVIPNSALAKARLTNLSSPDENHGASITVRMEPTASPLALAEVMRNVLLSSNSILKSPAPSVSIEAVDGQAVQLALCFSVRNISLTAAAKNEIFDLIYRHVKSSGYRMAAPVGGVVSVIAQDTEKAPKLNTPLLLLSNIPLFATLTQAEKETLASQMTRRTYRKEAIIAAQDTRLTALMIVRTGVVSLTRTEGERQVELARLAPGDCFGEGGVLMAANEVATARALTFVVIYELSAEHLAPLMHDRPVIAEELGQIMSRRIAAEKNLFADSTVGTGIPGGSLAARIRSLFQLPHD